MGSCLSRLGFHSKNHLLELKRGKLLVSSLLGSLGHTLERPGQGRAPYDMPFAFRKTVH